ncbi:MAG TPA: CPBP family intramembrane glutamic endopeptidase [Ktedonobacterales bacterium]|jgi:membrane protease YdiL (CAAX protease family)
MEASTPARAMTDERQASPDPRQKTILAILCVGAGVVALSTRYIPGGLSQIAYGVLVCAIFLALALVARRRASLRRFWELPFAFFILSVFVVLDNTVPSYFGRYVLHSPPRAGDSLASTVGASVAVQLVELVIAVVVVVGLTRAFGGDLGSLYLRPGRIGRALVIGVAGFVVFYALAALQLSSRIFPTSGPVSLHRYLALTPALLVVVLSNGFLEELVFRGLFLRKYNAFFGPYLSNVLQAVVFALAHVGVTYTPFALAFIVLIVFPLGLLAGYLMRSSNGIVASSLFHAGADIPIYLAFLSFVA